MIEAASNCPRCDRIRRRLRHIPHSSGQWGSFLAGVIAAVWAATLWNDGPGIDQMVGMGPVISLVGRRSLACWMTVVAVLPVLDALTDLVPLRVLGATLALVTWTSLLLEMLFQDGVLRPAIGDCLVGLLGCLNADIGLARWVAEGRR
jgi:hypothetical protein